eukprot:TRINITY_DN3233_c0_g1_i1.p1 TRINITY_DN3233_c0_g1~~TRINITY_DN3233_c0_g1_i1.p1  ORF type:complete len:197 (-),score=104.82 TRINITY_DN3233_c0_g1_i1:65-655(-)
MYFTKSFKTGFFGGEGFILQKMTGKGLALLSAGGALTVKDLKEGETIKISTGNLVAFEDTCEFDSEMVKGFGNMVFAGEGLFLANVTGPGRVWLQSLPFSKLVDKIGSRISSGGGFIPIGGFGGGGGGGADGGTEEGVDGDTPIDEVDEQTGYQSGEEFQDIQDSTDKWEDEDDGFGNSGDDEGSGGFFSSFFGDD